jgi:hypothetical protein
MYDNEYMKYISEQTLRNIIIICIYTILLNISTLLFICVVSFDITLYLLQKYEDNISNQTLLESSFKISKIYTYKTFEMLLNYDKR